MDKHRDQHVSDVSHPGGFLARLLIVVDIIRWLASLVMLSEQDLIDAGVYLGETHE